MTVEPDTYEYAYNQIGQALAGNEGESGIAGAFATLNARLRAPYARHLTEADRDFVREVVNQFVDQMFEALDSNGRTILNWPGKSDAE